MFTIWGYSGLTRTRWINKFETAREAFHWYDEYVRLWQKLGDPAYSYSLLVRDDISTIRSFEHNPDLDA